MDAYRQQLYRVLNIYQKLLYISQTKISFCMAP